MLISVTEIAELHQTHMAVHLYPRKKMENKRIYHYFLNYITFHNLCLSSSGCVGVCYALCKCLCMRNNHTYYEILFSGDQGSERKKIVGLSQYNFSLFWLYIAITVFFISFSFQHVMLMHRCCIDLCAFSHSFRSFVANSDTYKRAFFSSGLCHYRHHASLYQLLNFYLNVFVDVEFFKFLYRLKKRFISF